MKNSALIVIDLQNDIANNYKEIIEKVNEAINRAVQNEVWVVCILRCCLRYRKCRCPHMPIGLPSGSSSPAIR